MVRLLAVLLAMWVADAGGVEAKPPVYFTIATHSEDTNNAGTPDYSKSKLSYVTARSNLLIFAQLMQSRGVKWNFESDWNFLNGVIKNEITTPDLALLSATSNLTVIQFMHDRLGIEIDAHSHENGGYNYADVAYLISQTGVTPASVVGGHVWDPSVSAFQNWPRFINGIGGQKFPTAPVWAPRILMGGATPNHTNDPTATGIWKPAGTNAFFTHSDAGTMVAVGNWNQDLTRLNELLNLADTGMLPTNRMWTAGITVDMTSIGNGAYITNGFLSTLDQLTTLRDSGRIQFVQFEEMAQIWTNRFSGAGAVFTGATNYLTFSLNIQDFSYPDRSAAVLERALDLHEECNVPVDVFLTTTMVDTFSSSYPSLFNRLKTSPVVALSYHTRAPAPYRISYDWLGLSNMTTSAVYSNVMYYETHGLNLTNGQPTAAAGGYGNFKQLLGYAPFMVGVASDTGISATVDQVFADLGARIQVEHGGAANLGNSSHGMYVKPEHVDLLLFDHVGENMTNLLTQSFNQAHATNGATAPYFVGVKMHDNDFFAVQSAWTRVYIDGGRRRPDWDPSLKSDLLTEAEQAAVWSTYEGMVRHAASQRPQMEIVNARGILNLLGQSGPSGIVMSSTNVVEELSAGALVGSMSTWSTNGGSVFSIVSGAGDDHNSGFAIQNTQLNTAAVFDFETLPRMSVRLMVRDATGLTYSQPVIIQIVNVTTDDDDGDGLTEAEEALAGTNPAVADFSLRLLSIAVGSTQIGFRGSIVPGRSYHLQWSSEITGPWTNLGAVVSIASGTNVTVTITPPSVDKAFYRFTQIE